MSQRHLPEHAENALLALELARKEAAHLQHPHRTLFAQPIDVFWVKNAFSTVATIEAEAAAIGLISNKQDK